jgi:hypothetical protein
MVDSEDNGRTLGLQMLVTGSFRVLERSLQTVVALGVQLEQEIQGLTVVLGVDAPEELRVVLVVHL